MLQWMYSPIEYPNALAMDLHTSDICLGDKHMNPAITGGCLCGGVRYAVTGPLRDIIACHCEQCRRSSGHFVAATACRREQIP